MVDDDSFYNIVRDKEYYKLWDDASYYIEKTVYPLKPDINLLSKSEFEKWSERKWDYESRVIKI